MLSAADCQREIFLLKSFRAFMLSAMQVATPPPPGPVSASAPLRVMVISRRPYNVFVKHVFVSRQVRDHACAAKLCDINRWCAPLVQLGQITEYVSSCCGGAPSGERVCMIMCLPACHARDADRERR